MEAAILPSGRGSEKYYNLKGLLKSRDLKKGIWHLYKKKLDMPHRSTYKHISELKDSKHYYTSKAFSFSIL